MQQDCHAFRKKHPQRSFMNSTFTVSCLSVHSPPSSSPPPHRLSFCSASKLTSLSQSFLLYPSFPLFYPSLARLLPLSSHPLLSSLVSVPSKSRHLTWRALRCIGSWWYCKLCSSTVKLLWHSHPSSTAACSCCCYTYNSSGSLDLPTAKDDSHHVHSPFHECRPCTEASAFKMCLKSFIHPDVGFLCIHVLLEWSDIFFFWLREFTWTYHKLDTAFRLDFTFPSYDECCVFMTSVDLFLLFMFLAHLPHSFSLCSTLT